MAKYEVMRSFPDFRRGQIIEVDDWKNREKLVRTGYLRKITETKEAKPKVEAPATKTPEAQPLPAKKTKK